MAKKSYGLSERLLTLATSKGLNNKQFAEFVGISENAATYYLKKGRVPETVQLVKIAEKFSVSIDWLLEDLFEDSSKGEQSNQSEIEIIESNTDYGPYVTLKNVAVNGKVEKISSKNVIMYLQDLTGWNKTKIASDIFKISLSNLGNATREDRLDFYKIYEWASKNNIQLDFNELIGAHRTGQIGQAYSETPKIGAALSAHPKIGSTIQIKGETIPNTEINYLLNFTREILESDTDYAKSLDANIRSFHNAIETSSRLEKIETELSEMKQTIADLRKRDRRKGERRQNDIEPEIEKRTGTNRRTGT